MRVLIAAVLALALSAPAWAQESALPRTYIDTASGRITASAGFVWNGTQWVAASSTGGGGGAAGSVGAAGANGTTAQSVQGITGGVPVAISGGGAPTGTAGTPNAAVSSVQGIAGGTAVPVTGTFFQATQPTSTTPGTRTLVPLDVATVTTGGTAVTALTAGHKSAGGFIQNPPSATINLCINEIGTATGTTSAGSTTCITSGQTYNLSPSTGAVSVISSDSAHPFSGYGLN